MQANAAEQDDLEYVCLICLEAVESKNAIWNCSNCFCMFHLQCIQSWSGESLANSGRIQQAGALTPAHFPDVTSKLKWSCPKCRAEYEASQRPTAYFCFCGKVKDPPVSGWLAPHSCGEPCGRVRECGHRCSQTCHSGACSLCAITVRSACYCSKVTQTRRCATRAFNCGQRCGQKRKCGHECDSLCHAGECPPCPVELSRACECGAQRRKVICSAEPTWRCERSCGRRLACGKHNCERGCHAAECGLCPFAGERKCPCGKQRYPTLACDQLAPRCDETCDKLLACGLHQCVDQCHTGSCPPCLETVMKRCRCGVRQREQVCSSGEFTCDTRCTRMRDCGRHVCKRKCCLSSNAASDVSSCPPCDQQCGRQLACGVHKCASRCHAGACYPCNHTYELSCACGRTRVLRPCGRQPKPKRLPGGATAASAATLNCKYPCNKSPDCHHAQRSPHTCHQGNCPQCTQICDKQLSCGHRCKAACHSAVLTKFVEEKQRLGPWEKPGEVSYKLVDQPCPPCEEPVIVKCRGRHETTMRACFDASSYSCGRPCGRPLSCSNHSCENLCHELANADAIRSAGDANCAECERECEKPRPPGCTHTCALGACHSGSCPACGEFMRVKCHCQLVTLHLKCSDWSTADASQREALQSCKDRCPKLMKCGHRCVRNCHSAACSTQKECMQRVTLRCNCKSLKRTVICRDADQNQLTLPCEPNVCKQSAKNSSGQAVDDGDGEHGGSAGTNDGEQKIRRRRKVDKEEERLAKQQAKRDATMKSVVRWLKMFAPLFVILLVLVVYALLVAEK